jgi:hypothetical protein
MLILNPLLLAELNGMSLAELNGLLLGEISSHSAIASVASGIYPATQFPLVF